MRDNRPIETEAETYVCSRLAKMNLKFSKPNYDLDGGDIIVISQIDNETFKSINIQVKGRDITTNNSNVKIHKSFNSKNFVFFLYLRVINSFDDYLYCFFNNDISSWEVKDDYYYLNIAKKTIEEDLLKIYAFSKEKAYKILNIISHQKEKYYNDNIEWNLTLLDNNIRLWQKTNCLPDYNLTNWFLENTNFNYSLVSHNFFLTCLAIIHSEKLGTNSAVDYMFIHLKGYEIETESNVTNIKVIDKFYSTCLIAYPKSSVELLSLNYNGNPQQALRLSFGDDEEGIEGILINNGDFILSSSKSQNL